MGRAVGASVFVGVLVVAHAARAEPDPVARSTAQHLFEEARSLMDEDRFADACPKLEESQRIDPGPGTLFNLADCYEHVGRLASAWAMFADVASAAHASGRAAHEAAARRRVAQLEPKLPRLRIVLAPRVADATLLLDGQTLGQAAVDTAIPIDLGDHVVEGRTPDGATGRVAVRIEREGQLLDARLTLEPPQRTEPPRPLVVPDDPPSSSRRIVAVAVAGLGLVSIAAGSVFGVNALTINDESKAFCRGNVCNADGVSRRDDALDLATASTITIAMGSALLVGGALLFVTAPRSPSRRASSAFSLGF